MGSNFAWKVLNIWILCISEVKSCFIKTKVLPTYSKNCSSLNSIFSYILCTFRYVFNTLGKAKSMTHDSYFCHIYPGSIGFPTKRKEGIGNFVGAVLDRNDKIPFEKKSECPLRCRRKREWKFCWIKSIIEGLERTNITKCIGCAKL